MRARRFFVIAGEPSGDQLGRGLMAALKHQVPDAQFAGIGGPAMVGEGLTSLFPIDRLSVIGLADIVWRLPDYLRLVTIATKAAIEFRPDALITIDCPDFSLRVARRVKALSPRPRLIHYVAPSIWAWRKYRAATLARSVDHVLALLPFEPELMRRPNLGCSFVGHPAAALPPIDRRHAREQLGLGHDETLLLVLPGSRRAELTRLCPVFEAALAGLERPVRAVTVAASGQRQHLESLTTGWKRPLQILDSGQMSKHEKDEVFAAADVALAASGTVSVELAAAQTPMVIAYDVGPISRLMISSLLTIDTVTLVNLVSNSRAVPEFLGRQCRPEPIRDALIELIDGGANHAAQLTAFSQALAALGADGRHPSERAADQVMALIESGHHATV